MRNLSSAEWDQVMAMPPRNKNSDKYQKMKPETRKLLSDFYAPYNKKLAQLLGDDRWLWQDSSSAGSAT